MDLDLTHRRLLLDDDFTQPVLDPAIWLPEYLPQWTTPDRCAARYRTGVGLELRIDADQPAWSPEWNGELRVSNLQTGVGSGPVGSERGQHRFRPDLIVRTPREPRTLWSAGLGVVEVTLEGVSDPSALIALWMIGLEDVPERSAEVCIVEQFGRDLIDPSASRPSGRVGMGLHPFGDSEVQDDFATVDVDDVLGAHTYSVERLAHATRFFVDGHLVRTVDQGITYPMQLMLNLYELPLPDGSRAPGPFPRFARVHRVRAWGPQEG
ncbi:glycoside hydrolase family 16 protein [Microbacterium amylolyticum]|uniref:GH16 domain-containing protein n=1 Tax=Microbacterium amylolyticum TaxID=936337 RepID=A0ABS4ZHU9_9MICO|nr:glycoside hydrolase family 16 protein [Microbacterium amylolyticum]MBP2436852.1 hypothetical protein [Microbacterium amylolyticum]